MEFDTIILDDGIEYAIFRELKINDTLYTLFANVNDAKGICFRKTVTLNGEECYIGLDDELEFNLVSSMFSKCFLEENR